VLLCGTPGYLMKCRAGEQMIGVTAARGGRVVGGWLHVIGQCKQR